MTFVAIGAAGPLGQSGLALELEAAGLLRRVKIRRVAEAKDAHVLRVETCEIAAFARFGNEAAQAIFVAGGCALPGAFPAASMLCGSYRGCGTPLAVEA